MTLQAIAAIASSCILLLTIASFRRPLQAIAVLEAMQANVYYCKALRLLRAVQAIAIVNCCKLVHGFTRYLIAGYCKSMRLCKLLRTIEYCCNPLQAIAC